MLGSPRKNFTSLLYPNFTEELGQLSLNSQVGLGMAVGPSLPPDFSGPGRSPGQGARGHPYTAGDWLAQDLVQCRAGGGPRQEQLGARAFDSKHYSAVSPFGKFHSNKFVGVFLSSPSLGANRDWQGWCIQRAVINMPREQAAVLSAIQSDFTALGQPHYGVGCCPIQSQMR